MARVIATDGSGFIGTSVVAPLLMQGHGTTKFEIDGHLLVD